MKHVKMLGLLVMAAASLMAFASSASAAPTLTSPEGTTYAVGKPLVATLEKGSSALLKAGLEDTCTESSVSGTVETNSETHARGLVSKTGLVFGSCTKHTVVLEGGELTITPAGTVTAVGFKVTVYDTPLNVHCVYGAGTGTHLGNLEPSNVTKGTAKLKASTTKLKKLEGGFFCANEGTWTANYVVTTPDALYLS